MVKDENWLATQTFSLFFTFHINKGRERIAEIQYERLVFCLVYKIYPQMEAPFAAGKL